MTPAQAYAGTARAWQAIATDLATSRNMREAARYLVATNAALAFGAVGRAPSSERARVCRNHAHAAVIVAAEHSAAGRMGHALGLRLMASDALAGLVAERGGPLPWSCASSARLLAARVGA